MEIDQHKDNIVRFSGKRHDMKFPAVSEVRAYWEALRNGRKVPLRAEIDPRGIERALEYSFILERVAPQIARFRLAGMHLSDLLGMEVRGMPLTTFFAPKARIEVSDMLEGVFRTPQIAEVSLTAETGFGKPPMAAKLIVLPLQSDLGDISRALGCLMADGLVGRAPRRFEITEMTLTPIDADASETVSSRAHAPGFAEVQRPYDAAPTVERGHLRLVKTDN